MALLSVYKDLIDEIITQLKTITQLANDGSNTRVHKWLGKRRMKVNDYEAVVTAGPMAVRGGYTSNSTENTFTVIVDSLELTPNPLHSGQFFVVPKAVPLHFLHFFNLL